MVNRPVSGCAGMDGCFLLKSSFLSITVLSQVVAPNLNGESASLQFSSIKEHDDAEPGKAGRIFLRTGPHASRFVTMGPNFLLQNLRQLRNV